MSEEKKYFSHLERVLKEGHFAVTCEIGPPKSADPEVVREKARIIRGYVDAANITDCQTAIVRMSSIASGVLVREEGVEPVIQMTCRDRNRIAIQADLLGAAALGMRNLLCLTGDHPKFGNHPEAKGVFDLDSIQLLDMVRRMRDEKKFQCGEEIRGKAPEFFLGAAENPFADPFEFRVHRMAKKAAAGAQFIQTQIIYNLERFRKFMEMARDLGLTEKLFILAGVTPPKSFGMAKYMKYFVPGLDVPDEILSRLKDAKDKKEEGIKIVVEIIEQVREIPGVAGVHIMAIEWEEAVPEIVKRAGLEARPFAEEVKPLVKEERVPEVALPEEKPEEKAPEEIVPPKVDVPVEALKSVFSSLRSSMDALREGINMLHEGLASLEKTLLGGEVPPIEERPSIEEVSPKPEVPSITREEEEKAKQIADLLSAAKAAQEAVDYDKALSLYEQVLKLEPENEPAKNAIEVIKKEQKITELLNKAKEKLEAKELDEAEKLFKEVLDVIPEQEEAKAGLVKIEELRAKEKPPVEEKPPAEEAPPVEEKPMEKPEEKPTVTAEAPEVSEILVFSDLSSEYRDVSERAAGIPEDVYKEPGTAWIKEVTIGEGDKKIAFGGTNVLPFHLFEGEMKNPPRVAMEVLDVKPEDWPESIAKYFEDVFADPGDWAKKCVEVYGAEAINVYLVGTDPNFMNLEPAHAAKVVEKVANAVDVPLVIWGSGSPEKDVEVIREVANVLGAKNVMVGPVVDTNHQALGATAMGYGYALIASSPIDVNLAKQLNILLENIGVPLDRIGMDPSVGAVGYGLEYTYSVMERIRLAALYAGDDKLQVPFVINVGREVWKTKEAGLPSDEMLGEQEIRGIALEAITAISLLMAGGDFLIMRHPKAIEVTQKIIKGLMAV
ncbi:acetyl-CoA decarbonylase/synthase complex subunit delta [Thermodesulfatator indicus]